MGFGTVLHRRILGLLHRYALLLGITILALFMMHGAIYALMKKGALHEKLRDWITNCIIFVIIRYAITTSVFTGSSEAK